MTEIIYTQVGDYLLPNLQLNEPLNAEPLNRYGMMRKRFLKETRPAHYGKMLVHEELYPHCREVQQQAQERIDTVMEHLIHRDPPPDKATDQIEWVAHMNTLHHTAEEIIFFELIYK